MLAGTCNVGGRTARWAFTDRSGGVSPAPYASRNLAAHVGDDPANVRANREALHREFALGPLSMMGPVHGISLAFLQSAVAITPNVDGLATAVASVPLVTLGADCVPMLIAADDLVVAVHVGWRGFADGMTEAVLRLLDEHGAAASEAQVILGPAICGSCYGIPVERAELVAAACPEAITVAANGGPGADIRIGLATQWRAAGAVVTTVGPCTFEDERYFSHRRDGVTGRQGGVIAWQP